MESKLSANAENEPGGGEAGDGGGGGDGRGGGGGGDDGSGGGGEGHKLQVVTVCEEVQVVEPPGPRPH